MNRHVWEKVDSPVDIDESSMGSWIFQKCLRCGMFSIDPGSDEVLDADVSSGGAFRPVDEDCDRSLVARIMGL